MFAASGSISCMLSPVNATTITSIADACRNPIASLAVMFSSPTMIPISTSVTAIHCSIWRNPATIASTTPMRNAQLPMRLAFLFLAMCFTPRS